MGMGESSPTTRLQRLQRQRQRANQIAARRSSAVSVGRGDSAKKAATCTGAGGNAAGKMTAMTASIATASDETVVGKKWSDGEKNYSATRRQQRRRPSPPHAALPSTSTTLEMRETMEIKKSSRISGPPLPRSFSPQVAFDGRDKVRDGVDLSRSRTNTNNSQTANKTTTRHERSSSSSSGLMSRVVRPNGGDGRSVRDALDYAHPPSRAAAPSLAQARKGTATAKTACPPKPKAASVSSPAPKSPPRPRTSTDSQKSPSPKSLTESKFIAEARGMSPGRGLGRPAAPSPFTSKSEADPSKKLARGSLLPSIQKGQASNYIRSNRKGGDSWFQYTNGTGSTGRADGSGSSKKLIAAATTPSGKPIAGSNTTPKWAQRPPRSMEELQFFVEKYGDSVQTPIRESGRNDDGNNTGNNDLDEPKERNQANVELRLHRSIEKESTLTDAADSYLESMGSGPALVHATETSGSAPSHHRKIKSGSGRFEQAQHQPALAQDRATAGGRLPTRSENPASQVSIGPTHTRVAASRRSPTFSQCSMPSDEEASKGTVADEDGCDGANDDSPGERNMWKEMARADSSDLQSRFGSAPRAISFRSPSPSLNKIHESDSSAPPWAKVAIEKGSPRTTARTKASSPQLGNGRGAFAPSPTPQLRSGKPAGNSVPSHIMNASTAKRFSSPMRYNSSPKRRDRTGELVPSPRMPQEGGRTSDQDGVGTSSHSWNSGESFTHEDIRATSLCIRGSSGRSAPPKFNGDAKRCKSKFNENVKAPSKLNCNRDKASKRKVLYKSANDNKSIISTIRRGGTPVWIHKSILTQTEEVPEDEWEWARGYLHGSGGNKEDDSMELTVDDSSLVDLDGNTFTLSKSFNDGKRILLANGWWSSAWPPPSPTESMGVALTPEAEAHGMPPGDLVEMSYLHEPAIVHALRTRYERNIIYTDTGAILLALNPFKKLDHLYSRETMELYWADGEEGKGQEAGAAPKRRPPHVYAVAERAYRGMLCSLERHNGQDETMNEPPRCSQSILVSGESGAGKTVTTKIIMRYLSILSRVHADDSGDGFNESCGNSPSVEMQVLQSNPILESFGNARTIRNDNSSRFGKFIEMSFLGRGGRGTKRGSLLGASIDTYLLETVRLVSVNPGERGYHVFYEILSPNGMNVNEKRRYMLTSNYGQGGLPLAPLDFCLTAMSGTFDRRDAVDDSATFAELRAAMDIVGFSDEERDGAFALVAAILHASNLRFMGDGDDSDEGCQVYDGDGISWAVASLIGVSEDLLKMALTTRVLEARGEVLTKKLSMSQSQKALEAIVKAAYGTLFYYIVARINKSIQVKGDREAGVDGTDMSVGGATISVLDIFGFESFESNSFEQLCINYCNEALQQQFCKFVFKAEQLEYAREGIEWSDVDFPDNQEALDLIEAKRVGIFSVLDEQCRLPRRTDRTFVDAIYDATRARTHFSMSQMQRSEGKFSVRHYAGEVEYNSDGFLLKNKDELPKSATDLLASSTVKLIMDLAGLLKGGASTASCFRAPPKRSSSSLASATVSGKFASQLRGLRSRIDATEPHYIRCLKPNDLLVANYFDERLIAHQLNCAGVLPAMRIARAGFATRYLHHGFIQRYRSIVGFRGQHSVPMTCEVLIHLMYGILDGEIRRKIQIQPNSDLNNVGDVVGWAVQVGRSKVFVRTVASEALEVLRNSAINSAANMLQARVRTFLAQRRFYLLLGSALTLQCACRKLLASLYVHRLRRYQRSITIQTQWRCYHARYHYQNVLHLATWCQRLWRGGKVRETYLKIIERRGAIVIQSAWRCHVVRRCHLDLRLAAVIVQCFYRVCASTSVLKKLKREARDVHNIVMERDRLRMEMREMKKELEIVKNQCTDKASQKNLEVERTNSWSTAKTHSFQEERIRELDEECVRLRREVETLRGSGRSVPSTLPLTVCVDSAQPPGETARSSPADLSLLPSGESSLTKSIGKMPALSGGKPARSLSRDFQHLSSGEHSLIKSIGLFPDSPSLLDSEVEGLPHLECSHISSLPDSSVDYDERLNMSALEVSNDSFSANCVRIYELPFHQAIQNGDKIMLLDEIHNSPQIEQSINSVDSKGRTPLHIAAQCSNLEFAKILLFNSAVANTQDFLGNTALHFSGSPEMTRILLEGGINPNIPNCDGLCSLHLAVKRRDFISAKHLLFHGADVNNADDEFWYTPLHLVAHAEMSQISTSRGPIAEILCEAKVPSAPDLNYQDRDGNTPLHHAASLVEEDAGILISLFVEHGSCPNIANNRGQTPIHLFCHNHSARKFVFYHEALHLMLIKGADPNIPSLSGCTALHLALYHQDVEAAALLVRHGAEVNTRWKKPQKWDATWTDMGSDDVLPLDMLEDMRSLSCILAEITTPQRPAPRRIRCMHCKAKFGMFTRHHNCLRCGRSVCGKCCIGMLWKEHGSSSVSKVCCLCQPILLSKADTVPTTIFGSGCDQSSLGTISM